MTTSERNPLVHLDKVQDLIEMTDFVDDDDLREALDLAIKLIVKPHLIPSAEIPVLIVKFSAYSVQFRAEFVTYMTFKKETEDAAAKKNIYRHLYEGIDKLVDALKIMARYGEHG
jgi:hypothetical protein